MNLEDLSDFMMDDDLGDDKKKKIKSSSKGKRVEREVVDLLNNRFKDILSKNPDWGKFSRTIGSGNRFGQKVVLPKYANNLFAGDLITPGTKFNFSIESKGGYNDIDLCTAFDGKCVELDKFIKQAEADSVRANKKPLVLWKKDRKKRLAILELEILKGSADVSNMMKYKAKWAILSFDDLLMFPDDFWFDLNV